MSSPQLLHPARGTSSALAIVGVGVTIAYLVSTAVPVLGALTIAVLLGAAARNAGLLQEAARPGLAILTRRLLRIGVVLLGLQLSVTQILGLGRATLGVVVLTVAGTFTGTLLLGRLLKVRREAALLVATGFSICGASAVAAMSEVAEGEDEDVAVAVALVTIFGSVAIVVEPLLRGPLGLTDVQFGVWAGASVHEVAQVVATAQVAGAAALAAAVIVKLTRVVLLAPLVAGFGLARSRTVRLADHELGHDGPRPPVIPLFVCGFLAMIAVRSTGFVPASLLAGVKVVTTLLLAGALFGLGTAVDLRSLTRTGGRAVALGAGSTLLAATISYVAVIALT
jgi:uncharacterized integral membrane protein (TIGR00698 family)